MFDFFDINLSGMIILDIISLGFFVRFGIVMRFVLFYLIFDNFENLLNLNIDLFLDERDLDLYEREEELRFVIYVMLRYISKLKKIYSFYLCLGQYDFIDNIFVMSRFYFWRFLKDSKVYYYGFTFLELDYIIVLEKLSNFYEFYQEVLMREFLNVIVIIGYKFYNEDYSGNERVFFWCVFKFIFENIFQNYCKVGGSVFVDFIRVIEVVKLMFKSWNIFCGFCVLYVYYLYELIFKCRQFMFMFNDFRFINLDLSLEEVFKLIVKDNLVLV